MDTNIVPRALSQFRELKRKRFAKIGKREYELATQLRSVVPENLVKWIDEESQLFLHLFEYGSCVRKYYVDRGDTYDHTDLNEFSQRFEKLRIVWEEVISIDSSWHGDYRFIITITVV
ncbi:MAG: hypothetical protein KC736_01330 [Candidatus Moranbacteria bacterium]|nr:hypothetical protein [Candidatus Moranbacteria bacterium]